MNKKSFYLKTLLFLRSPRNLWFLVTCLCHNGDPLIVSEKFALFYYFLLIWEKKKWEHYWNFYDTTLKAIATRSGVTQDSDAFWVCPPMHWFFFVMITPKWNQSLCENKKKSSIKKLVSLGFSPFPNKLWHIIMRWN